MTEQELIKEAARIRGRRSWKARVKKWGGKKQAAAKMRLVRQGKVIPKTAEKA